MFAPLLVLILAVSPQEPQVSTPEVLQVGHVIEARGAFDEQGRFVAQKVVLEKPNEDDALLGTVAEDQTGFLSFVLLGQPVETDERTEWKELEKASLAGKRIKVEGSWKGPRRFRADSIEPRGAGRDRIGARIDALTRVEGGWEAKLMIYTVLLKDDTEVEHEEPVEAYGLAPERQINVINDSQLEIERDEDDAFGDGIALSRTLRLQGQLEFRVDEFNNFDLDSGKLEDRTDYEASARIRLTWAPSENLVGLTELRFFEQYRRDDDNGINDSENSHDGGFGETWLQWRNVAGNPGLDVTLGRQDFDDPREWVYDQNLDALRLSWIKPEWRFDVAAATTFFDGSERDEESDNLIAYLSNNDEDEYLAAWTVYRDIGSYNGDNGFVPDEESLHFGVRAIGEWIPQNELWLDFSYQLADRPQFDVNGVSTGVTTDVSAWAYDAGTTWSPPFADPLYLTLGYALGTGDGADGTFRQTGFQDNNGHFGGVTSFSYYGELFEPELSNLGILTMGLGARVAERTSLDFVFHTYTQDVASAEFSPLPAREANVRQSPNGLDAELGWEGDLILGYRQFKNWDLEVVGATFRPGDGFDSQDNAYYVKIQLRYRF